MILQIADIVLNLSEKCFLSEFQFPGKEYAFESSRKNSMPDEKNQIYIKPDKNKIMAEEAQCSSKLIYVGKEPFYPDKLYLQNEKFYYIHHNTANQPCLVYKIDAAWKNIDIIFDETNTAGRYAFEYLTKIIPFIFLEFQALVIHGALMEYDNKGIILSAPSGTGKSTHAHFWRDNYRGLIINGDRSLCRKKDGIWTGYGMPWCGSSGEYINRDVPIRAIVVLQQAEENEVRLLTPLEGFQRMYETLVLPQWDKDKVNQGLDLFDDMLANIPVYLLKCRPEAEAAAVLKREIDKL